MILRNGRCYEDAGWIRLIVAMAEREQSQDEGVLEARLGRKNRGNPEVEDAILGRRCRRQHICTPITKTTVPCGLVAAGQTP
jgi:hypothetical protein